MSSCAASCSESCSIRCTSRYRCSTSVDNARRSNSLAAKWPSSEATAPAACGEPVTQPRVAPSSAIARRSVPTPGPSKTLPAASVMPIFPPITLMRSVRAGKPPALGPTSVLRDRPAIENLQPQHGARLGKQRIGIERFGHIQIRAHLLAALAIEFLPLGRKQNNVDVAQAQFILHRMAHVEA